MHVAVIGAAGMIGRKLVAALGRDGRLGEREIRQLDLVDLVQPESPAGWRGAWTGRAVDLSAPGSAETVVAGRPNVIVHLAAVVSGEAEADFELGYRVNLDGTRALLDAIRAAHHVDGYRPRLVFASSVAVFGAPQPEVTPEDLAPAPQTSYGTQKAIGELLLSDYTRRGFVDGVGLRLPTICIRPGQPNQAASGFFSAILREPLVGREAVLPVPETVRHWHASPRSAVRFCLHAATIDSEPIGPHRILAMPGVSATVGEQLDALRRAAGEDAVRLIRHRPDPAIMRMIDGWPRALDASRAERLGFTAERSFDEIIRVHLEDELDALAT